MAFLVVLINVIFWGFIIYKAYEAYVSPKVDQYKDEAKAVEVAKKFGGADKLYDTQVSFFKDKGFRVISSSGKLVKLKKEGDESISTIELRPKNTEKSNIKFSATKKNGTSINFQSDIRRKDPNLQSIYTTFCEHYLYGCVDKDRSDSWGTDKDFLVEDSIGRKDIYKLRWEYIDNKIESESRFSELKSHIINQWLMECMVYPPRFFENARYLASGGYSNIAATTDKNISKSVKEFTRVSSREDHVRIPIWFISAFPDVSLHSAENKSDAIFESAENSTYEDDYLEDSDLPESLKKDARDYIDSISPDLSEMKYRGRTGKDFDLKEEGGSILDMKQCQKLLSENKSNWNFETAITFKNIWENKNPSAKEKMYEAYLQ